MKRLISYNVFEGDPNLIAEVSKSGYKTQRGTEVVTTNTTKAITLEANPN